jgi:hypothetical protein
MLRSIENLRAAPTAVDAADHEKIDSDIAPALLIVWIVSLLRVAFGVLRHEAFGAEATLALLCVLLIPLLIIPSWLYPGTGRHVSGRSRRD